MSRRHRQLRVRNPDVFLLLPAAPLAHRHARILRAIPVDHISYVVHVPDLHHGLLGKRFTNSSGACSSSKKWNCEPEAAIVGFLGRYGCLQLARILLDEDTRLADKIAADEYERLLGVAVVQLYGRQLPRRKGAAEALIDELECKHKISLHEKTELGAIWKTRNAAIHPAETPPSREAVEVMIDRIESICAAWERLPNGPKNTS